MRELFTEKVIITIIALVLIGIIGIVGAKFIYEPEVNNTTIVKTENFDQEIELPEVDTLSLDVKDNKNNIVEMSNLLVRLNNRLDRNDVKYNKRMQSIDNAISHLVKVDRKNVEEMNNAIDNLNELITKELSAVDYKVDQLDYLMAEYDRRFNAMVEQNNKTIRMMNERSIMVNSREIKKLERKIKREKDSVVKQELLDDLKILKGN